MLALDMVCIQRVLVLGVADNSKKKKKEKNCPSKGKHFILSFVLQKKKMSNI